MNKSIIKYLVLSDIHLGHPNTTTEEITGHLRQYWIDNHKRFKNLDAIFIAGDIFDRQLTTTSKNYHLAIEWLTELITYCKIHNIILRILEGTPSHDWKQASVLSTILDKLNIELDCKYIDTLHIEKNDKLGLNILYVPDEWKHTGEEVWKDVSKLLKKEHLQQVDIAIMHGQFAYQLPLVILNSSHDADRYLGIVKRYINIGHIHTHSARGRILAQGSFDRIIHGEEEDKGGILVTLDDKGEDSWEFIVNKHSKKYVTYDMYGWKLEDILASLDKRIPKLEVGSYVRIAVDGKEVINNNMKAFNERYPGYSFKVKFGKVDEKDAKFKLLEEKKDIESFPITENNIRELLLKEFSYTKEQMIVFDSELSKAMEKLHG